MYNLNKIMRNWTNEQWDAAQRVEEEANARLGEVYADVASFGLVTLVIEEQKRDPATTLDDVLCLAIALGVVELLSLRHDDTPAKQKRQPGAKRKSGRKPGLVRGA